uniref:Uncharacterized protein n=1 Tax=Heterorhabditis bacteriophora TaxID=37862 RepID=A0A1I7X1R0_HETBA
MDYRRVTILLNDLRLLWSTYSPYNNSANLRYSLSHKIVVFQQLMTSSNISFLMLRINRKWLQYINFISEMYKEIFKQSKGFNNENFDKLNLESFELIPNMEYFFSAKIFFKIFILNTIVSFVKIIYVCSSLEYLSLISSEYFILLFSLQFFTYSLCNFSPLLIFWWEKILFQEIMTIVVRRSVIFQFLRHHLGKILNKPDMIVNNETHPQCNELYPVKFVCSFLLFVYATPYFPVFVKMCKIGHSEQNNFLIIDTLILRKAVFSFTYIRILSMVQFIFFILPFPLKILTEHYQRGQTWIATNFLPVILGLCHFSISSLCLCFAVRLQLLMNYIRKSNAIFSIFLVYIWLYPQLLQMSVYYFHSYFKLIIYLAYIQWGRVARCINCTR